MTRPSTLYRPATDTIDPTQPGGIEQLLAFHHATFGDARMDAGDGATDSGDTGDTSGAEASTDTSAGESGASAAASGPAQSVDQLPDWAQKLIRDTRAEAANHRTKANDATKTQQDQLQAIGKALGLIKDGDGAPTIESLTEQLTTSQATNEASTAAARAAQVELAIYRTAGKHSADPDALLDSRTFLSKVKGLDPTAEDFTTQVAALIEDAVTTNPKLKSTQVVAKSGNDLTGGTGELGQLTREQFAALSPEDRLKAAKDGRARTILSGQ